MNDLLASPIPELALLAVSSSLAPGANSLLIAATGARFGIRRSLPTLVGMYAGFGAIFAAAGLGVAALLAAEPGLLALLQWAGALYLLHMAFGLLRARWSQTQAAAPPGFVRAALLQLLYPKLWLMALATLSLCSRGGAAAGVSLPLIALFVGMTLPGMLLYLRLGGMLGRLAQTPGRRSLVNRGLAALTGLSAVLLLKPL